MLKRKREDESSNRAHDFFTRTEDVMMGAASGVADFDKNSSNDEHEDEEKEEEDDDEMPSAKFRRGMHNIFSNYKLYINQLICRRRAAIRFRNGLRFK